MPFSQEVKTKAMVACARRCCICHNYCGSKMEVHHIKAQSCGGSNDFDNAIPLCFNCHAEVRQYDDKHPKGIKFTELELQQHRDNWYKHIESNQDVFDACEYIEIDKKTYYELETFLSRERLVRLRDINFDGGSFPLGYFDRIEFFPQLINDPKYEYMDKDIEQLKNELALCIIEFTNNSFPYLHCDDGKNVRIPPDMLMTNMEKYIDASEILNELSMNVWNKYSDYIKLCKRKLKVNVK